MLVSIFIIAALIISAIFHEYAHGYAAYKLGDHTAKNAGRLTMNPLAHLDPVGSILIPLLLVLSKAGFVIGWAKPVPYNPYNLRDAKYGDLKVALAGPGTNLFLAVIFGLVARFMPIDLSFKKDLILAFFSDNTDFLVGQIHGSFPSSLFILASIICFVNLLLMIFNLIPVPPLDGSKILLTFLPFRWHATYYRLEPYGMFIIIFLLWFGFINFILSVALIPLFTGIIGVF